MCVGVVWVRCCSGHGKLSSDVYCLNLGGGEGEDATPMTWSIPNLKGKGPSPRFDHCATLFPNNERQYFTVFGGQDNTQIFREVHYLDVETLTWQEETGMSPQMFEFEVSLCARTPVTVLSLGACFCLGRGTVIRRMSPLIPLTASHLAHGYP
jgi:dynein heavy chain